MFALLATARRADIVGPTLQPVTGLVQGDAAMEQISDLLHSGWQGPATMSFPEGGSAVTPVGSRDFSDIWTE